PATAHGVRHQVIHRLPLDLRPLLARSLLLGAVAKDALGGRRHDGTRRYGVDGAPSAGEVLGKADGRVDYRGLRSAVSRAVGEGVDPDAAGDLEHSTPTILLQRRDEDTDEPYRRENVLLEGVLPLIGYRFEPGLQPFVGATCVVDQDVDAAQRFEGTVRDALRVFLPGEVAERDRSLAAL